MIKKNENGTNDNKRWRNGQGQFIMKNVVHGPKSLDKAKATFTISLLFELISQPISKLAKILQCLFQILSLLGLGRGQDRDHAGKL